MRSVVAARTAGGGMVGGAVGTGVTLRARSGLGLLCGAAACLSKTSLRNASGALLRETGRGEVPVPLSAPQRAPISVPQAAGSEGGAAGGSSPGDEPALAFPLTEEETAELREAFDLFDPDGEGLIDVGDLKMNVRALGCELEKSEMKKIVSEFGEKGSGKVTFQSYLQAEPCEKKEILKVFNAFDCDGTGKISLEDLKAVAEEVGEDISEEELQEMIDEADVDGDGEVDEEEFLRILTLADL
ncbi:uncharacterized protein LOC102085725 isoform X2 [Columba livia]|uniref:uncharacterized protein LOC102085725 isoform X2 n=1 Tax=Columba livia TaxID=8932 RepID=UPI0031B9E8BD